MDEPSTSRINKYAVVQFDNLDISVVPVIWLDEPDHCYWPKGVKNIRTAIVKEISVKDNFVRYKCHIFSKYVPPTMEIWKHFVKGNITSRCKLSGVEVKLCGNTTNLNFHMQRNHPKVKVFNLEKRKKTQKRKWVILNLKKDQVIHPMYQQQRLLV
ncbi:hypothetical protein DMN91_007989 [Ooceraea biroi]|uniref:BED-type domain-containing protein n=1 Tax=Ooceraea biroi TaxID=2015173 RepID=A0A3L8DGX9_OOCBI|nr:hypothetical protein DMN91_007989 [Ooceraea biroi]